MSNNSNNGKGSSMAIGVIAFAIIVAIIVIFFTISANSNGGSPAKPVNAPEVTTEVADNESDASDSSSLDSDTEDELDVEEATEAEEEPAEEEEEDTEAEDEEEAEDGIIECPNCKKMVSKLERFRSSEDYDFFKLWCADCRAEIEDGTKSVDDIDFDSDVACDNCGETFSKHSEKNSIKNNGFCPECYESYQKIMEENGIEII